MSQTPEQMSILGCGWLGIPIAQKLLQSDRVVWGSTTQVGKLKTLSELGIQSVLLRVEPSKEADAELHLSERLKRFLSGPDFLITLGPSAASEPQEFLLKLKTLTSLLQHSPLRHVIFTSSTSVYAGNSGEIDEKTNPLPQSENGVALLKAEELLKEFCQMKRCKLSIARLAGLIGHGRHPGLFLSGRTDLINAHTPVNLIHQVDCANSIASLFDFPPVTLEAEIYNLVARHHPTRADFYTEAALKIGVLPPTFKEEIAAANPQNDKRIINGEKIRKLTGVDFRFDDFKSFLSANSKPQEPLGDRQ